ncbi:sensitivity to high expression protein she9, partial [Ceratobasidium sp. 392]
MLRLATTRRSPVFLLPRSTVRWATTGSEKPNSGPGASTKSTSGPAGTKLDSGAVGAKLNSGSGGTRSKSPAEGIEKADKVVKEYLDSLKPSAESAKKSTVVPSDSDVSRTAASPSSKSASTTLGEPKISSSPGDSKSPSPGTESKPSSLPVDPTSSSPADSKPSPPLATQADRAKQSLTMWKEVTLSLLRSRAQGAAGQLSELGGKLNKVTGYNEIEALKLRVVERERSIAALRNAAREAKTAYSEAVTTRASRQRQVNDLLQRKSSWSDADVLTFTQIVREDHLSAAAEQQAKLTLDQA